MNGDNLILLSAGPLTITEESKAGENMDNHWELIAYRSILQGN